MVATMARRARLRRRWRVAHDVAMAAAADARFGCWLMLMLHAMNLACTLLPGFCSW